VRKGCAGPLEIAILPQFFGDRTCEKVAFRAVSLALPLPPAFKREIEKKKRARGQEEKM